MKVTCAATEIPLGMRQKAGWAAKVNPRYQLTAGKVYDLYGLAVPLPIDNQETRTPWTVFLLLNDQDRFSQAPESLVRIASEEIPRAWKVWSRSGWLCCGYELLKDDTYFEALAEGATWAKDKLKNECTDSGLL